MSTETTAALAEGEARTETIVREFAAELTAGEGRTVDVRIVPYGERITHNDGLGGVPRGVDYTEEWMPGVFAHQVNAAHRVVANYEHQGGLAGVVGHGLALRDDSDGFHGSFVMHDTPDGDKALLMVKQGVLGGVSLEAQPVKNTRTKNGVMQRVKANLRAVALTRFPAYDGARVLAVREKSVTVDEDLLPVDMDAELVERLRAQGVVLPSRYEAHPAESDTPDESGTPDDDDTRPPTDNTDVEG